MKKKTKLMLGDNIESLRQLPDNSIDSIVTDPPYGLSFMNKKWDYDVPSVEFWKEVYRVLKPGGHILSFGGTRTYHRMVVNIEDAGFEIRDQVMWLYGSGFPKSHNIGLNIDKKNGETENRGKAFVVAGQSGQKDKDTGGDLVNGGAVVGSYKANNEWNGWGTALKPANEPICVARKPLSEKTIADNVIKWGTGGINIDGCRVGNDTISTIHNPKITGKMGQAHGEQKGYIEGENTTHQGRFPANIILDETAAELLDEQSGIVNQGHWPKGSTKGFGEFGGGSNSYEGVGPKDKTKSGASRFFYIAKVSKKERNLGLDGFKEVEVRDFRHGSEVSKDNRYRIDKDGNPTSKIELMKSKNTHPTLKPINLMTYLCRLVTPEGGIVLDPFMGSGSTGIAALLEGFRFVGMEMDKDYFKIAEARIEAYEEYRKLIK